MLRRVENDKLAFKWMKCWVALVSTFPMLVSGEWEDQPRLELASNTLACGPSTPREASTPSISGHLRPSSISGSPKNPYQCCSDQCPTSKASDLWRCASHVKNVTSVNKVLSWRNPVPTDSCRSRLPLQMVGAWVSKGMGRTRVRMKVSGNSNFVSSTKIATVVSDGARLFWREAPTAQ